MCDPAILTDQAEGWLIEIPLLVTKKTRLLTGTSVII